MRLDEPGDPYRCAVPGCTNRSRAHLCHHCYTVYVDFATGRLPDWLLALRREATRQAMAGHRAWQRGYDVFTTDNFDRELDAASEGWEDAVALVLDVVAVVLEA